MQIVQERVIPYCSLSLPLVHLHIIIWKERREISAIYYLYHMPINFSIDTCQNESGNNYQEPSLL